MDAHAHATVKSAAQVARPTVEALARRCVKVGRSMHAGSVATATWDLLELIPRLHRFLSYLGLCQELLASTNPPAAERLGDYKAQTLAAVDRMQAELDAQHFDRVGLVLARDLSMALLEYGRIAEELEASILPTAVAA